MDNFKYAFFDLDGTLIDSLGVWEKIDREFLGKRGFQVPADYVEKIGAMPFPAVAQYTIDRFGLPDTPEELLLEWTDMALWEYSHNIGLKREAFEYLCRLKDRGIPMGIITNMSRKLLTAVMENTGIAGMFQTFILTEEIGYVKTQPDIYLYAAKTVNTALLDCVYFEDLPECVAAAAKAGMRAYGVYDPHNDHLVDQLKAVGHGFLYDFSGGPVPV